MTVAISCVVDDSPRFLMQAWNWLASLNALGTGERARLFIHHPEGMAQRNLDLLADLGAELIPIDPFGTGPAAYCNKIRQLQGERLRGFDHVILSDTDLAFRACPLKHVGGEAVRARLVDANNPPEALWRQLFEAAGFRDPIPMRNLELRPKIRTFATNFNGGFCVIPGALVADLGVRWEKWARLCLDHAALLEAWQIHCDQIGFGMAMLESGAEYRHLDLAANFHTNLPKPLLERMAPLEIEAFHYHRAMDSQGLLRTVEVPWIDAQIDAMNERLGQARRDRFDNRLFWDFRYDSAPGLGSGLGSRGAVLQRKRAILTPYLRAFASERVIDVGCGDLETMRHMPLTRYHGIDVSAAALKVAREKRPDWRFDATPLEALEDESCDLAVCLDVLIHQPTLADFDALVAQLVRISGKAIIVSGYAAEAEQRGITFFAQPLRAAFLAHPAVADAVEIGSYRDVTMMLVTKNSAAPANPHDIALPAIAYGCAESPDWELLLALIAESRARLGFFPRTVIRTLEYPWFARRAARHGGGRVLDLGAGICVLPLWLSARGCSVVTLDNHRIARDPAQMQGWNEWGFLDYSQIDPKIVSLQQDAATFAPDAGFDAVYSVSVLEHLPAGTRRDIFARLPGWLAPGGRVYLSFDLVPGTRRLWALSEGRPVEPQDVHGTLTDVLRELTGSGLRLVETSIRRGIAGSRTDLAFVEAAAPL